jgi:hypothetical protein
LHEGAEVTVDFKQDSEEELTEEQAKARYEHYKDLIGALKDGPSDWSENHDKYLREEHSS